MFRLAFRWLAIPWLQVELNAWAAYRNETKKRADKHKILPQEIPNLIHAKPERFGVRNFMVRQSCSVVIKAEMIQVRVTDEILDEFEAKWAPPSHPVFKLVPDTFGEYAQQLYMEIGSPLVT